MLNGILPATWTPTIHAIVRIVTGLMFIEHGTSKVIAFPITDAMAGMYAQMGAMTQVTAAFEVIGGLLIIIGAFTRLTAFILAGFMAIAFWGVHVGMAKSIFPIINGGEAAALYCMIFLALAAVGAGPYSVDAARNQ